MHKTKVAVCSEIHSKYTHSALCGHSVDVLNLKRGVS